MTQNQIVAAPLDLIQRPPNSTFLDITTWNLPTLPYPTTPDYPPRAELDRGFYRQSSKKNSAVLKVKELSGAEGSWLGNEVYLSERNFHPSSPGAPFFLSMCKSDLDRLDAKLVQLQPLGIDVFRKVASNEWQNMGQYEVVWRGNTEEGELVGVLDVDPAAADELTRVVNLRRAWGWWCLEGRLDIEAPGKLMEQVNAQGIGQCGFYVLKCVGFNRDGLEEWVAKRNARGT